jgi:hypothetical protein
MILDFRISLPIQLFSPSFKCFFNPANESNVCSNARVYCKSFFACRYCWLLICLIWRSCYKSHSRSWVTADLQIKLKSSNEPGKVILPCPYQIPLSAVVSAAYDSRESFAAWSCYVLPRAWQYGEHASCQIHTSSWQRQHSHPVQHRPSWVDFITVLDASCFLTRGPVHLAMWIEIWIRGWKPPPRSSTAAIIFHTVYKWQGAVA